MMSIVIRALAMACLLLPKCAYSYTVVTVRDGLWTDPAIWDGGAVPDASAEITVNHRVSLPAGATVLIASLTVAGHLMLESGAILQLPATDTRIFHVTGILECADGSQVTGTSAANTSFEAGSRYVHRHGPLGFIPMASWDRASTFQISGFIGDGYINLAHASSWHQSFGNVEYDCPLQTVFVVDLNGHLRDIRGSMVIRNTNSKTLRLSTTQQSTINIGGNLLIEGTSQVWFTTNSPNFLVNIGGDFLFQSAATAASYLATRGTIRLVISGGLRIDAQSPLRMASSAADSTGVRQARIVLGGDLTIVRGSLVAPPSGSGKGIIEFAGVATQRVVIAPIANPLVGNLEYNILANARVALGESALTSEGGAMTVAGTLELGSTHPQGAIQPGNSAGNIRVPGPRNFLAGATIIYNGNARQVLGAGHPIAAHMVIDNVAGVQQNSDVAARNVNLLHGSYDQAGFGLTVEGDLALSGPEIILTDLRLAGTNNQRIDGRGASIERMTILKPSGSAQLISALLLTGAVGITGSVGLRSDGNLTLVSTSDVIGHTASIGPLSAGASITGDVTVQRFLSGEGRLYRYLSSPVSNATVASLMDDFPVTGTFSDPSVGHGIKSDSPSLYEYDESIGDQMKGWVGYPRSGFAADAPLKTGMGYAAYVRNKTATVLDFVGPVNQGTIQLPLGYTIHEGKGNGWHLVGNPYPSAIDWESEGIGKDGLSRVIAIRDNGDHRFRYWDGDDQYNEIPEGNIAMGQAFWVRALTMGASLTFHEQAKSIDASFYRRPSTTIPSLDIVVTNGTISDHCTLKIRRESTSKLDAWDGMKLLNDTLNVSTCDDSGNRLAINSCAALPDSISLRVTELPPSRYLIYLTAFGNLSTVTCKLKDHYLHITTALPLNEPMAFEVTADTASSGANRFTLYLTNPQLQKVVSSGESINDDSSTADTITPHHVEAEEASAEADAWLQIYPNPVSHELLVDVTCGENAADTSCMPVPNEIDRLSNEINFELYNAGGTRVDPDKVIVADRSAERNDLGILQKRVVLAVCVEHLQPGIYLLKLSRKGKINWLRFLKI
jgi:hypothetical protein